MTSQEAKTYLLEFLRKNKIDQKEFAKMIGKSEVTISRWLNSGKPLTEANINAIKFVIWSYPNQQQPSPPPERPKIVPNAFFINASETFKPVPLLTIAQAKELMPHGLGAANDIPADSLVHFPHVSPGDFAVQIAGNSMMPWYPPGTQLLVSREAKPQTGNRVIAMLADYAEPLFKIYIDLGGRFALYSINEQDGCAPLELDKMDKGETWYWVWKIKVSARDEDAVDAAMKEFGIHHGWEKWLEKWQAEQ